MTHCWHCGKELNALEYGRADVCRGCRRDTRVCRNCEHYDEKYNNACRENQADRVVDKEKSNFCDYFKPASRVAGGGKSVDAIKAAAEALFKKK